MKGGKIYPGKRSGSCINGGSDKVQDFAVTHLDN